MTSVEVGSGVRLSQGSWNDHDAIFLSLEEVSGTTLRSTKEYSLAYIPELDEWRGDVIAYGEWVDIDQEEIADLRLRYGLDDLVKVN